MKFGRKTKAALGIAGVSLGLVLSTACSDDAEVASENISKAADNFEVPRQIVFSNDITGEVTRTIEGMCAIVDEGNQLEVTCKVGEKDNGDALVVKHFLGKADNRSYEVFQTAPIGVSTAHYRVTFKPESVIPEVNPQGAFDE